VTGCGGCGHCLRAGWPGAGLEKLALFLCDPARQAIAVLHRNPDQLGIVANPFEGKRTLPTKPQVPDI
jgi:hypothetical protein